MVLIAQSIQGFLIGWVALVVCFLGVLIAYLRTRSSLVGYFAGFFMLKVFALGCIVFPYLIIPQNLELIGKISAIWSMTFFALSLLFLGLLFSHFWLPRFKNLIIGSIVVATTLQYIFAALNYSSPTYLPDLKAIFVHISFSAALWHLLIHIVFMTVLGGVFFYEGVKSLSKKEKIRYISLGLGMILASTTGGLIFILSSKGITGPQAMIGMLNTFAHLLMAFGIIYKVGPVEEKEAVV